jgi:hypothetical protein
VRLNLLFVLFALSFGMVSAQDAPATTDDGTAAVVTEGQPPQEAPAAVQPEHLFGDYLGELINLRNNLELLATAVKGTVRPDSWNGNLDVTDPQLPLLIRVDMELLLADTLGFDVPANWAGIVLGETQYQVRDLRHDIELLADALMGAGVRPDGWGVNPNPIWTCDRATQTLVRILAQGDFFNAVADSASPDYCAILDLQVVGFIEQNLFTLETDEVYFTAAVKTSLPGSMLVNSDFAVGFFDIIASQRAAVIPKGFAVTPLGRSSVQFSRMMLIEGEGFLLYVEYPFTSMTEDEFETLGVAPAVQTFCNADWC